jgi:tripartite-type tricarboxylate transporter receptor subunit TctC
MKYIPVVTVAVTGVLAAAFAAGGVRAADYPKNPIEISVSFGAGSAADVTARQLADGLAKRLNVAVPVVNRTGGGGGVSLIHLSQQKPDGYSLAWTSNQISTTYNGGQVPFDYKNYTHVAQVTLETPVLAVKADAPWKSLKELMEYAKANPEKVRIGNSGTGSHTHLSAVALAAAAGVKTVDVPFSAAEATTNLLGGRIEGAIQLPAAFASHVKAGTLRIVAALGAKREPLFPDVPTAKEQGVDVEMELWRGISGPKGMPADVVAALEAAIKETVASPEFKDQGTKLGYTPAYLPSKEFNEHIAKDDAQIATLMDKLGMKKVK